MRYVALDVLKPVKDVIIHAKVFAKNHVKTVVRVLAKLDAKIQQSAGMALLVVILDQIVEEILIINNRRKRVVQDAPMLV